VSLIRCVVARLTVNAHCTGEKLGKNIMDVRSETDATIKDYNDVLDTLMQRFRDRALNSTLLHVRDIGGR
jgi:hypothetical protein